MATTSKDLDDYDPEDHVVFRQVAGSVVDDVITEAMLLLTGMNSSRQASAKTNATRKITAYPGMAFKVKKEDLVVLGQVAGSVVDDVITEAMLVMTGINTSRQASAKTNVTRKITAYPGMAFKVKKDFVPPEDDDDDDDRECRIMFSASTEEAYAVRLVAESVVDDVITDAMLLLTGYNSSRRATGVGFLPRRITPYPGKAFLFKKDPLPEIDRNSDYSTDDSNSQRRKIRFESAPEFISKDPLPPIPRSGEDSDDITELNFKTDSNPLRTIHRIASIRDHVSGTDMTDPLSAIERIQSACDGFWPKVKTDPLRAINSIQGFHPASQTSGTGDITIIINNLENKNFHLKVNPTNTVDELEATLRDREGVEGHMAGRRLVINGRALDGGKTLAHYKIHDHSLLNMAIPIKIKKHDNSTFTLFVKPSDTVEAVKRKIRKIDSEMFPRLVIEGNPVGNSNILSDFNVTAGTVFQMEHCDESMDKDSYRYRKNTSQILIGPKDFERLEDLADDNDERFDAIEYKQRKCSLIKEIKQLERRATLEPLEHLEEIKAKKDELQCLIEKKLKALKRKETLYEAGSASKRRETVFPEPVEKFNENYDDNDEEDVIKQALQKEKDIMMQLEVIEKTHLNFDLIQAKKAELRSLREMLGKGPVPSPLPPIGKTSDSTSDKNSIGNTGTSTGGTGTSTGGTGTSTGGTGTRAFDGNYVEITRPDSFTCHSTRETYQPYPQLHHLPRYSRNQQGFQNYRQKQNIETPKDRLAAFRGQVCPRAPKFRTSHLMTSSHYVLTKYYSAMDCSHIKAWEPMASPEKKAPRTRHTLYQAPVTPRRVSLYK